MKCIHIQAVKVAPDRQRKLFDPAKLHEFADGIQTKGLLHPIVLRMVGDDYYLVAGERRLRAIRDIYDLGGTFMHDGQIRHVHENARRYEAIHTKPPTCPRRSQLRTRMRRMYLRE